MTKARKTIKHMEGGPFPPEIVGRLYAEIQLRRDAIEFRCACRLWNDVASDKNVKWQRWCKQRLSCALGDNVTGCSSCCGIGEFQCEVCEETEVMCYRDAGIQCAKCHRRLGPKCCVAKAPICVECVQECQLGCGRRTTRFIDKPWEFNDQLDDKFYYCNDCDVVTCYDCLYHKRDCFRLFHEYYYVSDRFRTTLVNIHR